MGNNVKIILASGTGLNSVFTTYKLPAIGLDLSDDIDGSVGKRLQAHTCQNRQKAPYKTAVADDDHFFACHAGGQLVDEPEPALNDRTFALHI